MSTCDNCSAETEHFFRRGGYDVCLDCADSADLPPHLRGLF